MTTDYSKLKNAELESLLKERSLPHTGKKADLISRLVDHDKSSPSTASNSKPTATTSTAKPAATADDEIDWDDDNPDPAAASTSSAAITTGSTQPATAALAAGGKTRVNNPQEVPNQTAAIDPAATDHLTVVTAPATTSTTAPISATPAASSATNDTTSAPIPPKEDTFAKNLAPSSVEEELAKRAARAAKFGTSTTESQEAEAKLKRAQKFGTEVESSTSAAVGAQKSVTALDEALPERRQRGRKREAEAPAGDVKGDDTGAKRLRGGRGADGEDGAGRKGTPGVSGKSTKPAPASKQGESSSWMSETDRKAAEARKARFAGTPATASA